MKGCHVRCRNKRAPEGRNFLALCLDVFEGANALVNKLPLAYTAT